MATVDNIKIKFNFSRGNETHTESVEFDACDDSLESFTIDDKRDELLDALNAKMISAKEDWTFDEFEIESYDTDWDDPDSFTDLDDYGEYAKNIEEFGEAYHLRHEDIGGIDEREFNESFRGTWKSVEAYAQAYAEDTDMFKESVFQYIDWKKYACDLLVNHSEYEGDDGIHIFSDC